MSNIFDASVVFRVAPQQPSKKQTKVARVKFNSETIFDIKMSSPDPDDFVRKF